MSIVLLSRSNRLGWLLAAFAVVIVVSVVRVSTGSEVLFSLGTVKTALIYTFPILLAALGGLWSERAGVINIGLEGQMILGTWGAAFFAYYGEQWVGFLEQRLGFLSPWVGFLSPWVGLIGAVLFGMIGGLLHALATVTFGVDHIVSGVAINLIGAGTAKFLATAVFPSFEGGGPKRLVGLAGPSLYPAALLVLLLVVLSGWVLWRTAFGLRLRSCGENPETAESLGIDVYRYKFMAVLASGGFAGLGGGCLALIAASGFTEGQTGGRGYIGLAAMIFGNWHPGGLLAGSVTFGYTDALRLRSPDSIHSLLLLVALILLAVAVIRWILKHRQLIVPMLVMSALIAAWYFFTESVPADFAEMTPYVVTMLVLAIGTQRLRMPAADGRQYRRGTAG